MADKKIRVLLVDDHAMVRSGVRLMLETEPDIRVIAQAETAHQALLLARENDFDVALVDIALPGKNGLELLKMLRVEKPKLAVLMLSTYAEDVYAVRAIRHGAAGYLTKNSSTETLVAAVRTAAAGRKHISAGLGERLANLMLGNAVASHESLSDRELEVLKLIATGESLVNIGKTLHLSPSTVTTYRTRILEKTNAHGNAKLAIYALENGLLN